MLWAFLVPVEGAVHVQDADVDGKQMLHWDAAEELHTQGARRPRAMEEDLREVDMREVVSVHIH